MAHAKLASGDELGGKKILDTVSVAEKIFGQGDFQLLLIRKGKNHFYLWEGGNVQDAKKWSHVQIYIQRSLQMCNF